MRPFRMGPKGLTKWKEDGHELCYVTVAIDKIRKDSFDDFFNRRLQMETWIDHGYQPYNLSLFQNRREVA
jgi:hypothetical protein